MSPTFVPSETLQPVFAAINVIFLKALVKREKEGKKKRLYQSLQRILVPVDALKAVLLRQTIVRQGDI